MEVILTKNNICDLNVFFAKKGMNNITRPNISYLKVDSAAKIQPAFHIGFENNMGFIDSYKINGGIMVFEVLEGYPLQDMLFYKNSVKDNKESYKFRLEDLEPMDFYCIQNQNLDVYGDFILKDLKFISTKMDQGVETLGRKLIAEFVCSEMLPFKIPYFYNTFISDDYNYHIIRNKKEIEQIKQDIASVEGEISNNLIKELSSILNQDGKHYSGFNFSNVNYTSSLSSLLDNTFKEAVYDFVMKKQYTEKSAILRIKDFIKRFYKYKNEKDLKNIQKDGRLGLFKYKNLV
jgi:hypothetical protein